MPQNIQINGKGEAYGWTRTIDIALVKIAIDQYVINQCNFRNKKFHGTSKFRNQFRTERVSLGKIFQLPTCTPTDYGQTVLCFILLDWPLSF